MAFFWSKLVESLFFFFCFLSFSLHYLLLDLILHCIINCLLSNLVITTSMNDELCFQSTTSAPSRRRPLPPLWLLPRRRARPPQRRRRNEKTRDGRTCRSLTAAWMNWKAEKAKGQKVSSMTSSFHLLTQICGGGHLDTTRVHTHSSAILPSSNYQLP